MNGWRLIHSNDWGSEAAIPLENLAARRRLSELMLGSVVTQLIYVAAKLGIPDLLKDGPMSVAEIVSKVGGDTRSLSEMMGALAALQIFAIQDDGRFHATPMGHLLRSFPGFRSQAILLGEEYYHAGAGLLHSAMTGESCFNRIFGKNFYEYLAENAGAAQRFNKTVKLSASGRYREVARHYDVSRAKILVDVGAGYGGLASVLLKANPVMRAKLVDSAPVLAGARRALEAEGLADRCEFIAADFFDRVPGGGDLYSIASVLSNWDDDRARSILENCRAAMPADGDLILVEPAIAGERPSRFSAIFAVTARAFQGSVVRRESEYRALLSRAGLEFKFSRALSFEPWMLMVATRP